MLTRERSEMVVMCAVRSLKPPPTQVAADFVALIIAVSGPRVSASDIMDVLNGKGSPTLLLTNVALNNKLYEKIRGQRYVACVCGYSAMIQSNKIGWSQQRLPISRTRHPRHVFDSKRHRKRNEQQRNEHYRA